jgi:hypothetical protein
MSPVTDSQDEYEIERLLNKRVVRREQEYFIEYLIRWREYESEFDRWYNIRDLENVKNLIADYEFRIPTKHPPCKVS